MVRSRLSSEAAVIETLFLQGPAGRIECHLKIPPADPGVAAAVVCHPHPLFGGTMHNKVVHATAGALVALGLPTFRFNFRGAGLSEGKHDNGRGEQMDLGVVLDEVARRFPERPLIVAGYSFGAFVGLRAGCADARVAGLIGVGVPVTLFDFSFLAACPTPLVVIQGDRDRFGPLPIVIAMASAAGGGGRVLPVPSAEHGFTGALDQLQLRVREGVEDLLRA